MIETMDDYSWLPADIQDFIALTEAAYPPDAVNFTIQQQRDFYDTMCASFDPPHPPGLTTQDEVIAGVACRRYTPTAARKGVTAIYFHGGGFIVGGLNSHDSICAELAEGAQVSLISVDYRLVPEHLHPAAFDDAVAVVDAVPGLKILLGDSAGANLAAAVSGSRNTPAAAGIAGQVLIYGAFGRDRTLPSYTRHANAPMLTRAEIDYYGLMRFANGMPDCDVTAAPLDADDFSALPPTAVFCAECDPVASDSVEYAARLADDGVEVSLTEEPGLVHGYLRARHMATGARESFARITQALDAMVTRAAGGQ